MQETHPVANVHVGTNEERIAFDQRFRVAEEWDGIGPGRPLHQPLLS